MQERTARAGWAWQMVRCHWAWTYGWSSSMKEQRTLSPCTYPYGTNPQPILLSVTYSESLDSDPPAHQEPVSNKIQEYFSSICG